MIKIRQVNRVTAYALRSGIVTHADEPPVQWKAFAHTGFNHQSIIDQFEEQATTGLKNAGY